MISLQTFCNALSMLQEQEKNDDDVNAALVKMCGSHVGFNTNNKAYAALRKVLEDCMNDTTGMIEWWLYEKVDKVVSYDDGETVDLTTPERLYEYLVKWYVNA